MDNSEADYKYILHKVDSQSKPSPTLYKHQVEFGHLQRDIRTSNGCNPLHPKYTWSSSIPKSWLHGDREGHI